MTTKLLDTQRAASELFWAVCWLWQGVRLLSRVVGSQLRRVSRHRERTRQWISMIMPMEQSI